MKTSAMSYRKCISNEVLSIATTQYYLIRPELGRNMFIFNLQIEDTTKHICHCIYPPGRTSIRCTQRQQPNSQQQSEIIYK